MIADAIIKHMADDRRATYAAMAMQGLCADQNTQATPEGIATFSVRCAKALIAELEKEPGQ
jgi:hypothetical protein